MLSSLHNAGDEVGNTFTKLEQLSNLLLERLIRDTQTGSTADPETVGMALAEKLKQQGADEILQAIFAQVRR